MFPTGCVVLCFWKILAILIGPFCSEALGCGTEAAISSRAAPGVLLFRTLCKLSKTESFWTYLMRSPK